MADEPFDDERALGVLNNVATLPAATPTTKSTRVSDGTMATSTPQPPPLGVAPVRKKPKHDSVVYSSVRITPSTDPDALIDDLRTSRFVDPTATMRALNIWRADAATVGVLMRYHAKGANKNDVRRRLLAATPVASEQIAIAEVLAVNADADELLTCLIDAQERQV